MDDAPSKTAIVADELREPLELARDEVALFASLANISGRWRARLAVPLTTEVMVAVSAYSTSHLGDDQREGQHAIRRCSCPATHFRDVADQARTFADKRCDLQDLNSPALSSKTTRFADFGFARVNRALQLRPQPRSRIKVDALIERAGRRGSLIASSRARLWFALRIPLPSHKQAKGRRLVCPFMFFHLLVFFRLEMDVGRSSTF